MPGGAQWARKRREKEVRKTWETWGKREKNARNDVEKREQNAGTTQDDCEAGTARGFREGCFREGCFREGCFREGCFGSLVCSHSSPVRTGVAVNEKEGGATRAFFSFLLSFHSLTVPSRFCRVWGTRAGCRLANLGGVGRMRLDFGG